MPSPRPRTVLLAGLAGVGGVVVGVLGTYVHLYVVGASRWPVGLILAVALTACAGRFVNALRLPTSSEVLMVVGWAVVYLLGAWRRPEGDLMIPATVRGLLWFGLGLVALVVTLTLPGRPRPAPEVRVSS